MDAPVILAYETNKNLRDLLTHLDKTIEIQNQIQNDQEIISLQSKG